MGSCDSHVTSPVAEESNHLADHVTKHVTMTTEFESSTPMCSTISERTPFFIGDIKLEMEENETDEGVDFEVSSPTKSDTDINCRSLNPVRSASRTEILHSVLTVDTQVQSSQPNYGSVSTASPMSSSTSASVCSHSSHPSSPRTLSPSPTPPCHKNEKEPQENWNRVMDSCDNKLTHEPQDDYRHKEEEGSPIRDTLLEQSCPKTDNDSVNLAEQEDEWPDLTDFSQSTQKADLQVAKEPHSESTPEWLPPAPSSSCHFGHLPPPNPQAAYPHPNFMMPPGGSGFAPGCQTQTGYNEFYSHPVGYWPGPTGFIPQPDQCKLTIVKKGGREEQERERERERGRGRGTEGGRGGREGGERGERGREGREGGRGGRERGREGGREGAREGGREGGREGAREGGGEGREEGREGGRGEGGRKEGGRIEGGKEEGRRGGKRNVVRTISVASKEQKKVVSLSQLALHVVLVCSNKNLG